MPVVTVLLYQDASTANDSVHLRFSPHTPASILPLPPSSRSYTGAILLTVVSHRYAASSAQERGGRKEWCGSWPAAIAATAAISVVGLDVGNDTLVAAAARQRGIDVLLNAESNSKREWPAAVAFSHSARLLGTHDAGAASSHAPFSSPKRLLLLLASRPATRDLPRLPFDHLGRRIALSPTHILAMFLAYLRQLG
ncbi:hypothetical protein ZWY2020_026924 [Hordeum vulgare]|nr:hypothetical protein ZWY2020_026924 [Hordeum vulgare]